MAWLLLGCSASKGNRDLASYFPDLPAAPPEPPLAPPAPRGAALTFIFTSGEFKNPGRFAWTNGMTLKDGIDAAGGFTDFAWLRITLQHWDGSVERYNVRSNWFLTNNPALRPGDQI